MSRFDVYPARSVEGFLLDLQSDYLSVQSTRVVAPLLPESGLPARIKLLHPKFEIDGASYVLATHLVAAVPLKSLLPATGNLSEHADQITRALDMLFQGH